jgi:hypothetical protein
MIQRRIFLLDQTKSRRGLSINNRLSDQGRDSFGESAGLEEEAETLLDAAETGLDAAACVAVAAPAG